MTLNQVKCQTDIQMLLQKFNVWRAARARGEKIPKDLWEQTINLAKKYPPNHVARTMGLNPKQLEKRSKSFPGRDNIGQVDLVRVAPVQLSDPSQGAKNRQNSLVAELITVNGTHLKIFSSIDDRSIQALSRLIQEGL
jgi:hypothetical protein